MDHARGVYLIMLPGQHQCQVLGRHASRQTCLHVGCILVCFSLLLILNKCCSLPVSSRSNYRMPYRYHSALPGLDRGKI